MKKSTQILIILVIISSLNLRAKAEMPGITKCTASGVQGINTNLTLTVTYNGESHCFMKFIVITESTGMSSLSCSGLWKKSEFPSFTNCKINRPGTISLEYPSTSISTATFIFSGFTFRPNSQIYSDLFKVLIRNKDSVKSRIFCSSFTSPSYTGQLLSNYLYAYIL